MEIPAGPITYSSTVQLLSDSGRAVWYNDGVEAKALPDPFTKFRSDRVAVGRKVNATWTLTGSLARARALHTATLLGSGKVLVAGGWDPKGGAIAATGLYDPTTGTWSLTGSLHLGRWYHTATLLNNGKVLFAGSGTPELYDP